MGRFLDFALPEGAAPRLGIGVAPLLVFFTCLAEAGDPRRVFVCRRVCKKFLAFIDGEISNDEWHDIYLGATSDPNLRSFLAANGMTAIGPTAELVPIPPADSFLGDFGSASGGPTPPAAVRAAQARVAAEEAADDVEKDKRIALIRFVKSGRPQTDPGVVAILAGLLDVAIRAAVEGRRFAAAFDITLRGYTYYAVYGWSSQRANNKKRLMAWWAAALQHVQMEVGRRTVGRPAAQATARASVDSFVKKMALITFHASRETDKAMEVGERLMSDWHPGSERWQCLAVRPHVSEGAGSSAEQ